MKRIKSLAKKGATTLRRHKYRSLAAVLALVVIIGVATFLVIKSNGRYTAQQVATTASSKASTSTSAQETSTQPTTSGTTDKPADQPTNTPTTNTPTTRQTPSSTSQKSLLLIPSSFTIKAGENPPISVRSNDGKGINMPMFGASSGGKFFFNFPAGPAKSNWVGSLMTSPSTAVGTYTYEILAQDNGQAYYKGTITINIVQPTMNIAVQSLGYDANYDSVDYKITINRLYGFNESITNISMDASEPGLDCYYDNLDANPIEMSCGHGSGARPTTGTLSITVNTFSLSRSATTAYSFPPSP